MVKISALPPAGSLADDDETPFVDDSTASTKKFTLSGLLTWLGSKTSWITTAMISDGAVTGPKLDSSAIGQGYLEIARTTLSSAGDTITVSSIPNYKYLRLVVYLYANGGTLAGHLLRFNNDSGNNYADRYSVNGSADVTTTTTNGIVYRPGTVHSGGLSISISDIINIATLEKYGTMFHAGAGTLGVANAPGRLEGALKWVNTSVVISRIDIINIAGTGDFGIGSEIVVYGKN